MRFSLEALVRWVVFGFLGLNVVAVGLGRLFPERSEGRRLGPGAGVGVNAYVCRILDTDAIRFLDSRTGELERLETSPGESLDFAAWSPWSGERGASQVVARWMKRSGREPGSVSEKFGLARLSFPTGEVIDRVESPVVPAGPPCWFPDTTARILFVGGDGQIYRFAFEPAGELGPRSSLRHPEPPAPLTWRVRPPGEGRVHVYDLCWPTDARFRGLLLATLSVHQKGRDKLRYRPPILYWLRLDRAGTAIEDAGPLSPTSAEADDRIERMPAVAASGGQSPVLAWLTRRAGETRWRLRAAVLRVDPGTGTPSLEPGAGVTLTEGCAPTPPMFSSDGRWVAWLRLEAARTVEVERTFLEFSFKLGRGSGRSSEPLRAARSDRCRG